MKRILVIDDSQVARTFHMSILKSAGFKVDGATDGTDALEKSLRQAYDLILCDINMPHMDGLTYIRKYRAEDKETPIIVITTQEEFIYRQKEHEAGANLSIVKPVKPQLLIMHIQMLIGEGRV